MRDNVAPQSHYRHSLFRADGMPAADFYISRRSFGLAPSTLLL